MIHPNSRSTRFNLFQLSRGQSTFHRLYSPLLTCCNLCLQLIDLSDLTLAAREFNFTHKAFHTPTNDSTSSSGTFFFATKHHDVTLRYKHWLAVLTEAVLQRLGPEYELVKEEKLVGVSSTFPFAAVSTTDGHALTLSYACSFILSCSLARRSLERFGISKDPESKLGSQLNMETR